MFKWLLISKYLRRKLAPLFAAVAVTICTAMVIIVMSVMGGFLDLLRTAAHQLTGDVTVLSSTYSGMPHYEDLIRRVTALDEVEAATPVVYTVGLLQLGRNTLRVEVLGVRPRELEQIVGFEDTLLWGPDDYYENGRGLDMHRIAMDMAYPPDWPVEGDPRPPVIIGVEVNPTQFRDEQGRYDPDYAAVFVEAVLTVLPVSQSGAVNLQDAKSMQVVVVNEFKSGLYEIDASRVYAPFDALQQRLRMNEAPGFDPETGELTGDTVPARAGELLIKAAPGYTPQQAADAVERVLTPFLEAHPDMLPPQVLTWQQRHATLLSAVQNEKGLVTFLFIIISAVAVVMVATTFYMIVLEKTRDIGVLRAIGASRSGVRNLFLGYGLAIGTLGALIGLALAAAVVMNLNEIQALLDAWFGWKMWDPRVYFFERIPDRVDWIGAAWVVLGAIVSSVVGALIPAIIAARMNPVEALRYE